MKKISKFVVNHTKLMLIVFLAAALAGAYLQQYVGVNYDVSDYLPEDSASTAALDVMDEEFDTTIPNCRVMVQNVTIPEALEYKEALESIDGVLEVTWLDDALDITVPLETQDTDTIESYYKEETALFSVAVAEDEEITVIAEIRELIGDDNAVSGSAVSGADGKTGTVSEIQKIFVIAVIYVIVILAITTTSWIEPLLVLFGLAIAILINMGSNLIFGEISFITNAAGAILQMAVSLDYSVFLIHRYEECYERNGKPKEAMQEALCKSFPSILSSGLTTLIGFLALIFMRYRIGSDLGLALAKGVVISLITVFFFTPALVLTFRKLLERTHHRLLMPDFHIIGKGVQKIGPFLVIVFAILLVPSYLASNSNSFYYGSAYIYGDDTRYGQDTDAINAVFGEQESLVLMVPEGDTAAEQELSDALHEIEEITSIISYVDTVGAQIPEEYLAEDTLLQLRSGNYSRYVLTVDMEPEGEETFAVIEEIRETAQEYYPDTYYLAGEAVSSYDLMDTITADMTKVNLIAICAVFLVLLLTTRKPVRSAILVLCIETAIWINLSFPYFKGDVIFYISYLIISSIQLGCTVDYAILISDRYEEFRIDYGRHRSVEETIAAVMTSVITSGSTLVICGFLLGKASSHGILALLGTFLGRGSLLSLLIVLFVLPGFLVLTDRRGKTGIGRPQGKVSGEQALPDMQDAAGDQSGSVDQESIE